MPEIASPNSNTTRDGTKRHLESYMFEDEILRELCAKNGQAGRFPDLQSAKQSDIAASVANGHPSDDMKSASGRIRVSCQRILGLVNAGASTTAFMRDVLVPLVTPDTRVYRELKSVIFGP